ncbi:pentapeptide repeat-containing protein [Sinosporangium album]|uniref:pentapeptide repeat-containing protein n=1 Tax=Sinosporangium album TaxID=504805 RepID=UPI0015A06B24|nr:pentapeptide repeat-containing protein [Sinosporangium album]
MAHRPYGRCFAHLDQDELADVLASFAPGKALDARGTALDDDLLSLLLDAARDKGVPVLGRARFDGARFTGEARFREVLFTGDVSFDDARFERLASFFDARFKRNVSFRGAHFLRELSFHEVRVAGHTSFDRVIVGSDALFGKARFERALSCEGARFDGFAAFDEARFGDEVSFRGSRFGRAVSFRRSAFARSAVFDAVRFTAAVYLSPSSVGRRITLAGARADKSLEVAAAGCSVDLRRVAVLGPSRLRLAEAEADLAGAVLRGPATVTGRGSRLTSLRGVHAERLTLSEMDLSTCRFDGLHTPEALRLSRCNFAAPPRGVRVGLGWPPLRWWSTRAALADEAAWRGWSPEMLDAQAGGATTPDRLAALYTGLGAVTEDKRTAADFAFAAMEMRRHGSRSVTRWLLSISWLACGYGLRMGRVFAWLALVAVLTAGAVLWSTTEHLTTWPPHSSGKAPAAHPPGTAHPPGSE